MAVCGWVGLLLLSGCVHLEPSLIHPCVGVNSYLVRLFPCLITKSSLSLFGMKLAYKNEQTAWSHHVIKSNLYSHTTVQANNCLLCWLLSRLNINSCNRWGQLFYVCSFPLWIAIRGWLRNVKYCSRKLGSKESFGHPWAKIWIIDRRLLIDDTHWFFCQKAWLYKEDNVSRGALFWDEQGTPHGELRQQVAKYFC